MACPPTLLPVLPGPAATCFTIAEPGVACAAHSDAANRGIHPPIADNAGRLAAGSASQMLRHAQRVPCRAIPSACAPDQVNSRKKTTDSYTTAIHLTSQALTRYHTDVTKILQKQQFLSNDIKPWVDNKCASLLHLPPGALCAATSVFWPMSSWNQAKRSPHTAPIPGPCWGWLRRAALSGCRIQRRRDVNTPGRGR